MTRDTLNKMGSTCLGKEPFDTAAKALKAAKNMGRFGKGVEHYRCPACKAYHIGRRRKPKAHLWR